MYMEIKRCTQSHWLNSLEMLAFDWFNSRLMVDLRYDPLINFTAG